MKKNTGRKSGGILPPKSKPKTKDADGKPMRSDGELLAMAARWDEAMLFGWLKDRAEAGIATVPQLKQLAKLKRTTTEAPGFCPLWFNSEHERERFYRLKETKRAADIATALECVSRGNVHLSAALSNWVLRLMNNLRPVKLTEDEATLLALILTPAGETKETAIRMRKTKFLTQRQIATRLGVSHTEIMRREHELMRQHPLVAKFLRENGIARKARGTRPAVVPNSKIR